MITTHRKRRTTGVPAMCVAVVLVLLGSAPAASAAPITRVGDFFFDFPADPTEPVVHLTNEWTQAFSAFTIAFESDLTDLDGNTTVDVRPVASTGLAAGDSIQIFAFDLTPPDAFLSPLTATLTRLVLSTPGSIFYSYDGGGTFVNDPILNFSSDLTNLGIFFAAADPPTVPEPGTLILLATGAAVAVVRRARRKNVVAASPACSLQR
jgi:ABC-type glycerol-3-phosphate transport system substrate-binding protein